MKERLFSYRKVMLVDNYYVDNYLNERILKTLGVAGEVVAFDNPFIAINYLIELESFLPKTNQVPDLIFLDITMPNMNGFEFIEAFNHLSFRIKEVCKIVVLSSYDFTSGQISKLKEKNVVQVLKKPLVPSLMRIPDFV
jgi:CheY-like chemotaxis protein